MFPVDWAGTWDGREGQEDCNLLGVPQGYWTIASLTDGPVLVVCGAAEGPGDSDGEDPFFPPLSPLLLLVLLQHLKQWASSLLEALWSPQSQQPTERRPPPLGQSTFSLLCRRTTFLYFSSVNRSNRMLNSVLRQVELIAMAIHAFYCNEVQSNFYPRALLNIWYRYSSLSNWLLRNFIRRFFMKPVVPR